MTRWSFEAYGERPSRMVRIQCKAGDDVTYGARAAIANFALSSARDIYEEFDVEIYEYGAQLKRSDSMQGLMGETIPDLLVVKDPWDRKRHVMTVVERADQLIEWRKYIEEQIVKLGEDGPIETPEPPERRQP